jgi:outer membrane receptor for ferrienterochelin and colicin
MDSENKSTGDPLFNVPEAKVHLGLEYNNLGTGFRGKIRLNYIGEQLSSIKGDVGIKADPYTKVNFNVAQSFGNHFELFGGVDNIFDKRVIHVPETGRVFYFGLSTGF